VGKEFPKLAPLEFLFAEGIKKHGIQGDDDRNKKNIKS